MSEEELKRKPQYGEKNEKDEKDEEKTHEKEEKSWDEKWRRDPLNAAVWALILIWGGLVLLADNFNLFDSVFAQEGWDYWPLFFLGAGVLLLLEVLVRVLMPAYRAPVRGAIVLGIIFLGLGVSGLLPNVSVWAIVLIALGLYFLLSGLFRKRP